jgi:hypothetical protein
VDALEILHFVFDYVLNDKMKNKNSVELCELCGEKPNAARSVPTPFRINYQLSIINYQLNQKTMEQNKSLWSKILNIVITVLTAIATTFGVTSCIGI